MARWRSGWRATCSLFRGSRELATAGLLAKTNSSELTKHDANFFLRPMKPTSNLRTLVCAAGAAAAALATAANVSWCMEDAMELDGAEAAMDLDEEALPQYVVPPELRAKYGRYLPWCRLNVDQVPLPFVNDMEVTYETTGAKRVVINQLGPSMGKRQATGQLCFRPAVPPRTGCTSTEAKRLYDEHLMQQPAPCIIFRGKGNINDAERDAYPEDLVVLWQDKAWVDRPVAVEWAEDVIKPFMEAERKAGVADASSRYLLFQDNLDSQKQPGYINKLREYGVDDHKLPPNETDQVQPIEFMGRSRML